LDIKGKRIPIFEGPAAAEMLSEKRTLNYLAEMLSSLARTNSGIVYWKERGSWHKKKFCDTDLDDMIELTRITDPDMRPGLYQRIADLALFLSGIFPEQVAIFATRRKCVASTNRTLKDYEQTGKSFYRLAALKITEQMQAVLGTLSEKFPLARLALNSLSDRYLKTHRSWYFRSRCF
jgi:hypothetical protein